MYLYDPIDQRMVDERVAQFRDQVSRFLAGDLSEAEFLPLRLMNGLYMQRHAHMLRVAIPYGLLSSTQLRMLAHVARRYDRGYGHFTTRQNIQYNWPKLEETPDLLADLASVQMHAIQTSGNCVRNISADHFAGVSADEVADPRPYCEILRQYSTFHPEFNFLPRKFKIAFTGASHDRAAIAIHDIGFRLVERDNALGFEVFVGGGLGRTPILAEQIHDFLPPEHLQTYTAAILRVYNLGGDRKDKHKARIKIQVRRMGIDAFRDAVHAEWLTLKDGPDRLTPDYIARFVAAVPAPRANLLAHATPVAAPTPNPAFDRWLAHNVQPHKIPGYNIAFVNLKLPGVPPGDITADQMDLVADLADKFSFSEIRAVHDQNLVLAEIQNADLFPLWQALDAAGMATPNIGTLADMICCPGLDFCSLANASSISISHRINDRFDDLDYLYDLGEIKLKMSGCINACGHHHVGHIGILGIDKRGEEFYQVMLGGSAEDDASLGTWIGPAIAKDEVVNALERLLLVYVEQRQPEERFLDTYRRIGVKPFSARVYADAKVKPARATADA
jgi:sulfite reductase (NADPH) hemoprotein beta-component